MLPEGCDVIDAVLQGTADVRESSRVFYLKVEVDRAFVPRVWTARASAAESGACR